MVKLSPSQPTDCMMNLFDRFDLIFLMLDPQDEQFDRRLATHLVSLYHQSQEEEEGAYLVSHTHFFSVLIQVCSHAIH